MNTKKLWICERCWGSQAENICDDIPDGCHFSSQKKLIDHIRRQHLLCRIERSHTVFICAYGPGGICSRASDVNGINFHQSQQTATFDSEFEYENHLVKKHLINMDQAHLTSLGRCNDTSSSVSGNWTQYDSVVNMAAVLNDPKDRQLDIFSRYFGEEFERLPVAPNHLPLITEEHLFSYLATLSKRRCPPANALPKVLSPSTSFKPIFDPSSGINNLFCSPTFDLANEETFARVIPLQNRQAPANDDSSVKQQQQQQQQQHNAFSSQSERLSQHLDAIELSIVRHVSEQSPVFFKAVHSHDTVRDQLSQTANQVRTVRERLDYLDTVYCRGATEVARLRRRRANYKHILSKLEIVASVHSAQPTIQFLLKTNDFCSALDLIASTQEALGALGGCGGERLACLRHLGAQLTEIAKLIHVMVESQFQTALRTFLAEKTSGEEADASEHLVPCVMGLLRIGQTDFFKILQNETRSALTSALEASCGQQRLVSAAINDRPSQPNSSGACQTINEVFQKWLEGLKSVCTSFEQVLQRVRAAILAIVPTLDLVPNEAGSGDANLVDQLRRVHWEGTDWSQRQLAKLVTNFSRQRPPSDTQPPSLSAPIIQTQLTSSDDMLPFLESLEDFHIRVVEPAWSFYWWPSRPGLPLPSQSAVLRNLITAQASTLLQRVHVECCSQLDDSLVREDWRPSANGLSDSLQRLLNYVARHQKLPPVQKDAPPPSNTIVTTTTTTTIPPKPGILLPLLFPHQGDSFVVAETIFSLVGLATQYLRLAEQFAVWPSLLRDVEVRLAKLFTVFNSRSCELVLGAGARKRSVLSTISARNLALVARSLEALLALILVLRPFFTKLTRSGETDSKTSTRKNSARGFVDPFSPVEQALRTHVAQLVDKLTCLLASRITCRLGAWQPRPPNPSAELRAVCQAMTKLTETTADILHPEMLTNLLLRVHVEFKASFQQRLAELSVTPDGGPQQGLVDSELSFYMACLRGLTPSLGHFIDDCDDVWPPH